MGLEEDCVELSSKPPVDFLESVHLIRGFVPEVISNPDEFSRHPVFDEFKPWGFGRSAWEHMDSLPVTWRRRPPFGPNLHRERLFSKAYWKGILGGPGRVLASGIEIDGWLREMRFNGEAALIKSARGTSGRGHLRVEPEMSGDPALRAKLMQRIAREGELVAEPFHAKLADFSAQYEILPGGKVVEFEPRIFFTDSRFQYRGAMLGKTGIPGSGVMECILRDESAWRQVHRRVLGHLLELGYTGPLGVDAMVVQSAIGMEVVPVIEVNVRHTMGRVALEIEKAARRFSSFRYGIWRFFGKSELSAGDGAAFLEGMRSFVELDGFLKKRFGDRYFATQPALTCLETWSAVILDPEEEILQSWGFKAT
jgi:hypothetical protein